jgi:hypothetical protein
MALQKSRPYEEVIVTQPTRLELHRLSVEVVAQEDGVFL